MKKKFRLVKESTFTQDVPEREKRISSATLIKAICIVIAMLIAVIFLMYPRVKKINAAAEQFDAKMLYESQEAFPTYDFNGDYVCAPDPEIKEILLTDQPLPKEPTWVKEGKKDLFQDNLTDKALFTAKYLKVKNKLSEEDLNKFKALGIGYLEHPQDYDEVQLERIEKAVNYLLS